jgi:HEAT repeat protein
MSCLWGGLLYPSACSGEAFRPATASFDELLIHAQRYGTTGEKRKEKEKAREELFRRKTESLAYLVDHLHIENLWIRLLTQELVQQLGAEEAVPVLERGLGSLEPRTRKYCVYFLGAFEAPELAGRVRPLLEDPETVGTAARTLGKWKIAEAVPDIARLLDDEDERRRVLAVNALGDIGDAQGVPHLLAALGDVRFTVRKSAARALAAMGPKAEQALVEQSRSAGVVALREIIHVWNETSPASAVSRLRELAEHADPMVRSEAAAALSRMTVDEEWAK